MKPMIADLCFMCARACAWLYLRMDGPVRPGAADALLASWVKGYNRAQALRKTVEDKGHS